MRTSLGLVMGLVASSAVAAPQGTERAFSMEWFRDTDGYRLLVELVPKADRSVPGVTLTVAELDAALRKVRVADRDIEWVQRFSSPVSRRKQRKRVRSVMHILLSKKRVAEGRRFAKAHKPVIDRVAADYDVAPSDLVSMMNAESRFGKAQGDFPVVAVFAANVAYIEDAEAEHFGRGAYDEKGAMSRQKNRTRVAKRRRYAAKNLLTTLRYAKSRGLDPMGITGSWAGAIGITQFMPASLRWAKDGDGNGVVDLSTVPDAVASTANYLVEHGYKRGDLKARRKAFHAYNPNREYVNAIVAYADRFESGAR